ncbi:unnamed protein product [Caenorhabditis angaria]|uniref:Receptor L-domain domain-containing protein n=1 Tax=Caenorhabditis angaria TaxID=860376 RepID=A0A9P1IP99_9PELO|nr:unnamed protein product [Caenorhabditis angaria]
MIFLICLILFIVPTIAEDNCNLGVINILNSTVIPESCKEILARVRISSGIQDAKLAEIFKNVRKIEGVLEIWNSDLIEITFLSKVEEISGDFLDKTLSIVNNSRLEKINISSLTIVNGMLRIVSNPLLNLRSNCDKLQQLYTSDRVINNNLDNCGCDIHQTITYTNTEIPENCTTIYGKLHFDGASPPYSWLKRLKTVTKLYGSLIVENTNLETLGFLENLKEIISDEDSANAILIQNNEYLERFDLLSLEKVTSKNPEAVITFNNCYACIDPQFVRVLVQSNLDVWFPQGGYCDSSKINYPSQYCNGSILDIPDRCTKYIGNIVYANPDAEYFWNEFNTTHVSSKVLEKLKNLEQIYGTVLFQGTDIEELLLPNIEEMYQISYSDSYSYPYTSFKELEVIKLVRNVNLVKFEIPKLKIAMQQIAFEGNGNFTVDSEMCFNMTLGMNSKFYIKTEGYKCYELLRLELEQKEQTN